MVVTSHRAPAERRELSPSLRRTRNALGAILAASVVAVGVSKVVDPLQHGLKSIERNLGVDLPPALPNPHLAPVAAKLGCTATFDQINTTTESTSAVAHTTLSNIAPGFSVLFQVSRGYAIIDDAPNGQAQSSVVAASETIPVSAGRGHSGLGGSISVTAIELPSTQLANLDPEKISDLVDEAAVSGERSGQAATCGVLPTDFRG